MGRHKRVIAYTALHYGADYLAYAVRSVIDHIDQYYVLYSPAPSHGHRGGSVPIPKRESRDNIHAIAKQAAGEKLIWVDGDWTHEGQQRDYIYHVAPDADVILVLDSDEIWHSRLIERVMFAARFAKSDDVTRLRIPIIHYWRSFSRCVLHDPAFPERVIFPQVVNGQTQTLGASYPINHMGYAIRPDLMRYKLSIHGHKNEFPDIDTWYQDTFLANAQVDCHPIGSEYWNPETVNPLDQQ